MHEVPRQILATIAAYGVLHGQDSFTSYPGSLSAKEIRAKLGSDKFISDEALQENLASLTTLGMLRKSNTGHKGYGDVWIDGHDTWKITEAGLCRLWGAF